MRARLSCTRKTCRQMRLVLKLLELHNSRSYHFEQSLEKKHFPTTLGSRKVEFIAKCGCIEKVEYIGQSDVVWVGDQRLWVEAIRHAEAVLEVATLMSPMTELLLVLPTPVIDVMVGKHFQK